jgi:hypothetical protein
MVSRERRCRSLNLVIFGERSRHDLQCIKASQHSGEIHGKYVLNTYLRRLCFSCHHCYRTYQLQFGWIGLKNVLVWKRTLIVFELQLEMLATILNSEMCLVRCCVVTCEVLMELSEAYLVQAAPGAATRTSSCVFV